MPRTPAQKAASRRNLVSARKARAKSGTPTKVTTASKTVAAKGNTSGSVSGRATQLYGSKKKLTYDPSSSAGRGPIRMSGT